MKRRLFNLFYLLIRFNTVISMILLTVLIFASAIKQSDINYVYSYYFIGSALLSVLIYIYDIRSER